MGGMGSPKLRNVFGGFGVLLLISYGNVCSTGTTLLDLPASWRLHRTVPLANSSD